MYGHAHPLRIAHSHDSRAHHPNNALAEVNDVEVQKQTDLQSAQSQVRQQLCSTEWDDLFDSLQFENDALFHEEVETISGIEMKALVRDWQFDLCFESERRRLHLVLETCAVRALQKSGPKLGVDLDRRANDPFGELSVNEHFCAPRPPSPPRWRVRSQALGQR